MATTVLEGTWEDIVKRTSGFAGRRLRVTVEDSGPTDDRGHALGPSPLTPEERIALLDRVLAMNGRAPSITDDAFDRDLLYAEAS